MVTLQNWEEYAILRADGELDAAGAEALEAFLGAHPELAEEAALYDGLRLVPDTAVVFAGKENLLKPEPRVMKLHRRWMWAAAAGMALLIGAAALLRRGDGAGEHAGGSVANEAGTKAATTSPVVRTAPVAPARAPIPFPTATPRRTEASAAVPPAASKRNAAADDQTPSVANVAPPAQDGPMLLPNDAGGTPLPPADLHLLAVDVPERNAEAAPSSIAAALPAEKKPGLLARLVPGSERLGLASDLRATASDRLAALRAAREKLRGADVTVSVGKRDLFTIHL